VKNPVLFSFFCAMCPCWPLSSYQWRHCSGTCPVTTKKMWSVHSITSLSQFKI